ncbi:MAG: N-acetylglucosaminidase [Candidatus Ornithomonoglobus sp.]
MVSVNLKAKKVNKIPFNKIPKKRSGIKPVAFLCTILVVSGVAVNTHNDGQDTPNSLLDMVTRTPIDSRGFFYGINPRAGIMLSWHDNTIRLDDENGNSEKLSGVLYPVTVPDTTLEYTSSNDEIAEIDENGNITAKTPGSIEISVKNGFTGQQSKAYLQVIQPVTGFYLEKSTIDLYTTDAGVRLKAEIMPNNASDTNIQWYSKDTNIVEVDQNGGLVPVNTGMTEIVATTTDGGFTGKCFVNVINKVIKAESVTIQNKENVTLKVGESWDGIVSVLPANAKNKTVDWITSDEKIVTVTKTGTVHAVGEGTVTITATSPDGPCDTVDITVRGIANIQTADAAGHSYTIAASGVTYTAYSMTLDEMVQKQQGTPLVYAGGSGGATTEEVRRHLDPNQFCSGAYKYQFMDLSHCNGISEAELAKFLEDKGTLSGQAATFIEAAREYNVSEMYLVAHACLETGYGTSTLASGVEVNGTKVYNMFGIAAYDGSVVSSGSKKAYQEGWTSPAEAIRGGAKWISENYINATNGNRQNTLYKMRWNPDNPGVHLYAGDIAWATTQATILERLFAQFPNASIAYDIPVYSGSNAAVIDDAVAMANTVNK